MVLFKSFNYWCKKHNRIGEPNWTGLVKDFQVPYLKAIDNENIHKDKIIQVHTINRKFKTLSFIINMCVLSQSYLSLYKLGRFY